MLRIGDFSKLSRISIRMLRHYDQIGLLIPDSTDASTNYRYYNESQLPIANRITALKNMGFSLAAISKILQSYNKPEVLAQFLELKQIEIQEHALETKKQLRLIETALKRLRKDLAMIEYDVTLKELPERYVASVRKTIPTYDQESILWNILGTQVEKQMLQTAEPCYGLAIFHDEGYKENNIDVEIQISLKGSYENTADVTFKTVPPILIASSTFKGSYEKINEVNEAVAHWMKDNHYKIAASMFCIYHVSPAQTQNPDELVTEVCYPVEKIA